MVKPGPASKKRGIMLAILDLLSRKSYGFRELHRSLPREHRAGSFATLSSCTNFLKSEGYIEQESKTKKLRLTPEGELERRKQSIINEISEAKMVAGCTSSSDTSPIRYACTLAKQSRRDKQSLNRLYERLRVDPVKECLFSVSCFIAGVLENGEINGSTNQKHTLEDVLNRLYEKLPLDMELTNIVSVDITSFLTWLRTPSGIQMLKYVLEQKREGRTKDIANLARESLRPLHHPTAWKGQEMLGERGERLGTIGERLGTPREREKMQRKRRN